MVLRYLFYLTMMNSGHAKQWKLCHNAWVKFSRDVGDEKYEELMGKVSKFHKKYAIIKK